MKKTVYERKNTSSLASCVSLTPLIFINARVTPLTPELQQNIHTWCRASLLPDHQQEDPPTYEPGPAEAFFLLKGRFSCHCQLPGDHFKRSRCYINTTEVYKTWINLIKADIWRTVWGGGETGRSILADKQEHEDANTRLMKKDQQMKAKEKNQEHSNLSTSPGKEWCTHHLFPADARMSLLPRTYLNLNKPGPSDIKALKG